MTLSSEGLRLAHALGWWVCLAGEGKGVGSHCEHRYPSMLLTLLGLNQK